MTPLLIYAIEDTTHFLSVCPSYATLASSVVFLLKNKLNHLGNQVQLYLSIYGHDSMSNIDNRVILLTTIK